MKRILVTVLRSTRLFCAFICCVVLSITVTNAYAQTDNWNGGYGNWSNPGNWSQSVVPSLATDTTIYNPSGGYDSVTLDTLGFAKSLTLGGPYGFNASLTDGGVPQVLTIANSLIVGGRTGNLDPYGGTAITAGADSSNAGYIQLRNGSSLSIMGNLDNSLVLAMYGGSALNVTGMLTNEPGGSFYLAGSGDTSTIGALLNYGGSQVNTRAALTLANRVDNFADITLNGTMVTGTGTATGPGYFQFANGTLGEHISMSQFGVIVVGANSVVDLNGTLDIQLASGFNPAIGSSYDIITFTSGDLTGTFSSILNGTFNNGTEKWVVIYNNSSGSVELLAQSNVSTVPEASSFILLGTSLVGLSYGLRRRT